MAYNYRFSLAKYKILRKHKRAILALTVLLAIVVSIYLLFIWYIHQGQDMYQPQTEVKTEDFNPYKTFRTDYFSFDTDKSWKYIAAESSSDTFVYRSFNKHIVVSDLTVFVNTMPKNRLLTRVLPVTASGDRFIVGSLSDHCRDYLKGTAKPGNNNPIEAVIASVRINCQVDGTSYTVGTGLKGGSYQVPLFHGSGKADYYLLYHDLAFTPQPDNFVEIAQSFRSR